MTLCRRAFSGLTGGTGLSARRFSTQKQPSVSDRWEHSLRIPSGGVTSRPLDTPPRGIQLPTAVICPPAHPSLASFPSPSYLPTPHLTPAGGHLPYKPLTHIPACLPELLYLVQRWVSSRIFMPNSNLQTGFILCIFNRLYSCVSGVSNKQTSTAKK